MASFSPSFLRHAPKGDSVSREKPSLYSDQYDTPRIDMSSGMLRPRGIPPTQSPSIQFNSSPAKGRYERSSVESLHSNVLGPVPLTGSMRPSPPRATSPYRSHMRFTQTTGKPFMAAPDGLLSSSSTGSVVFSKLTEELEAVRRAWKQEGQDLRGRMMAIHDAKAKAEQELNDAYADIQLQQKSWAARIQDLEKQVSSMASTIDMQAKQSIQSDQAHKEELLRLRREADGLMAQLEEDESAKRRLKGDIMQLQAELASQREALTRTRAELDHERKVKEEFHAEVNRLKHALGAEKTAVAETKADSVSRITTLESTIHLLKEQLEQQRANFEAHFKEAQQDRRKLEDKQRELAENSERQVAILKDESIARASDLQQQLIHAHKTIEELRIANAALHEALVAAESEFAAVAHAAHTMTSEREFPHTIRSPRYPTH